MIDRENQDLDEVIDSYDWPNSINTLLSRYSYYEESLWLDHLSIRGFYRSPYEKRNGTTQRYLESGLGKVTL
ncbi:hypothetical protein [Spirochaeta cellobiosiphila]|uniref:hypothetical protein n=1 Tax=Spirochaeta cellobiosiphila TaxID=504483 RepID=UPI00041E60D1|nr:hypothetical protein [Spirochaeta cellobiosiphila]